MSKNRPHHIMGGVLARQKPPQKRQTYLNVPLRRCDNFTLWVCFSVYWISCSLDGTEWENGRWLLVLGGGNVKAHRGKDAKDQTPFSANHRILLKQRPAWEQYNKFLRLFLGFKKNWNCETNTWSHLQSNWVNKPLPPNSKNSSAGCRDACSPCHILSVDRRRQLKSMVKSLNFHCWSCGWLRKKYVFQSEIHPSQQ